MSSTTRAERERLIAQDDGDAETTVYTPVTQHNDAAYHEEKGCRYAKRARELTPLSRADAHRQTLYPCQACVLGGIDNTGHADHYHHKAALAAGGED